MMLFAQADPNPIQRFIDAITFEMIFTTLIAGAIAAILTLFDLDEVFYVPKHSSGTRWERFKIKCSLGFWWYGFIFVNGVLSAVLFLLLREPALSHWNAYAAATVAGFGYLALVRVKITTVNDVPIGLELAYEKAKKYAYKRINRIVTEARKVELAQMVKAKDIQGMMDDVLLSLQTDALLTDGDRGEIKKWVHSVKQDQQLTEYEKKLYIGNFLLSGSRPNNT